MHEWYRREPVAKLGDVIQIKGYGSRKFEVYAVYYSFDMDAVDMFEDIYYDVASLDGKEYLMAWQEDIVVLETPDIVDYERLETHASRTFEEVFKTELVGLDETCKKPEEPKYVRKEITEKVDELLDEMNDYIELISIVGEDYEEGDGKYRRKVDEIKTKLSEIVGGSRDE